MSTSLDFFPVDLASLPEFVGVYAVIGIVGLAVGKLVAALVASALDAPPVEEKRSRPDDPPPRFCEGVMPRVDELAGVAYLAGGLDGVVSAIVAEAITSGWLYEVPGADVRTKGSFAVGRLRTEASSTMRAFATELGRRGALSPDTILAAARAVADKEEPALANELGRAGLLRSPSLRVAAPLGLWAVMAPVVTIGFLRAARDGSHGASRLPGIALALAFVVGAVALSRVSRLTDRGQRYLDWLEASTGALRARVAAGGSENVADTTLVAGFCGLAAVPELAAFTRSH